MGTTDASSRSPAASVASSLQDGKVHLLLAASGSVATIKLPLIISSFAEYTNLSIRVILTKSATHFLAGQSAEQPTFASLAQLPNVDGVYLDEDEYVEPWTRGAPILHIELRRWSHLLVICPMSANLLARLTHGLCDDLLTSTIRAWDTDGALDGLVHGRKKRIIVAPAMNTAMWTHPLTAQQIRILEEDWGVRSESGTGWYEVLRPQEKALACGDTGVGAMIAWQEIVEVIKQRLGLDQQG